MGTAQALLENFHILVESDNIELRPLLMDLRTALRGAELTEVEWQILRVVYLDQPIPPSRTGKAGHPKGGSGKYYAASVLNISPYIVRKSLRTALKKIEVALNYTGENDTVLRKPSLCGV
jgi:hypothetical protein